MSNDSRHPASGSQRNTPKTGSTSTLNEERPPSKKFTEQDEIQTVKEVVDDWDTDPINPRNWPSSKKWTATAIVSFYTFVPPLASSMMAPGLPSVAARYGITSPTVLAMTLSIFLLSFAIGPLFLAPLSEIYGRTWVLHIGNLLSIAFSFGCAFAPSTGALLAFRFLAGFSGSAPIACGGGSISDLFAPHERASAMALYTLGPLIGPVVGPIAGGFLSTVGIKYVFIVIGGLSALASIIGIPLLRETYGPVVRARSRGGDIEKHQDVAAGPVVNPWEYLWTNLKRPIVLLFRSYICFLLSLYMAFIYGIYYLMFTTFAELFSSVYGFKPGVGGLVYLGLGIGFLLSTAFGAKTADGLYKRLVDKNGGVATPEMRIPALFIGSLFVPVGLFWYGWSAQARIHWIMPIIGSGIFGFGMMTTFLPIQLYLVDTFRYAASALAAASVFRSMLGFAFPLFARQMFDALGLGGGNSLLAGLAIVLGIPFPIWLYYKGAAIRARSELTR
ncbi:mfs multidrug [Moniliophthora roreri MCA 2997]|uniref:Mfs multidrug n=1 Tax=Moniliophthora roreri (strain MCA 2997) TaxID=1381753 RepID=V2X6W4_MONRO|nr:mfs multidrug [Moniliophthora roreri MCA 2997]